MVIEVAAQALTQYRVLGIPFAGAAWLNFSQEHGEFYPSELYPLYLDQVRGTSREAWLKQAVITSLN